MSATGKKPTEVSGKWLVVAFTPALVLYLAWTLPAQPPLLPDSLGRFQLVMVFLCPLFGLAVSVVGRARFAGDGRGLLAIAAIGYAVWLGLVVLVALSPPWGPT
jgi:hypothetical protein